jgi:fibronectin type 3 domain-containing protein
MPRLWLLLVVLVWSGCGYIGERLPPALQIPQRAGDISAVEHGGEIAVTFTLPAHTTDDLAIRKPVDIELGVGIAPVPFLEQTWAAAAKVFNLNSSDQRSVEFSLPAGEWIGKDVTIGVRVFGSNGRTAGWSKLIVLSVVPPLEPPGAPVARAVAEGVRISWPGAAPRYRIYRRLGNEPAVAIGESDRPEYIDTKTEYGTTYHYWIEGIRTGGDVHAVSRDSAEVSITPEDRFPRPAPTNLAAVSSTGSIELLWDRSTALDLAGYRIYRAEGPAAFGKVGETRDSTSYSDRKIEAGKNYRYAVTAFDNAGNESGMSATVAVTAQ